LSWRASTRGSCRVELVVVAAVMLVLAAIAIPRVPGAAQTHRVGAANSSDVPTNGWSGGLWRL
jgi:Tfp pilus assembly protein FimT